jgi:hypothetical protein
MEKKPERLLMADRVSMALFQEADVRRNHEFFNGRNAARTPLSTVGQERKFDTKDKRPHERLLHSGTSQMVYANASANPAARLAGYLRQQFSG